MGSGIQVLETSGPGRALGLLLFEGGLGFRGLGV